MQIDRAAIFRFGKLADRTVDFAPGINIVYGKNEAGKSTMHTFIRGMLFGIQPQRGRASKNDLYSKYEPWENPAEYGGIMWFTERTYLPNRTKFPEKQEISDNH